MVEINEILRRVESGPYIKEADFDLRLFDVVSKLVRDHGIEFHKDVVVASDDNMADAVFEAGLRLCLEMGMLCTDTSRVIGFSEEEIRLSLRTAQPQLILGAGKDARTLRARRFDDGHPMTVCGGAPGAPLPEELFVPIVMSYVKEPLIDILNSSSLAVTQGMEVKTGGPLEIRASRQEVLWLREALERAGRPGMHIYAAGASSPTELGVLAVSSERYMRTTDSCMIPVLSEMKTDYKRLSRVVAGHEYPAFRTSLIDPIIGGFAGGPEGAAAVLVAGIMVATAAYGVDMHCLHPIHNKYVSVSTKESMWVDSIVGRAFARNAPLPLLADAWTTAGTGTEEILYETAALAICQETSALNTSCLGATNGIHPNCSGLEARFFAEVVHAVFEGHLAPDKANALVLRLFEKYEQGFENPNLGLPFPEVYDSRTVSPKEPWLDVYLRVKDEVSDMGLNFVT